MTRTCVRCRAKAVEDTTVDRVRDVKHKGETYTLDLKGMPARVCGQCRFTTFGPDDDDFVASALRRHIYGEDRR